MTTMTTKTVSAATATSLDNGPSAHGLVVKVGRAREPAIRDGAERRGVMHSPGDAGGFGPREQRPNGNNTTERFSDV